MTHVEELCRKLETASLLVDRELGVVLRAAIVADKAEAAKPPICRHCGGEINNKAVFNTDGEPYHYACYNEIMNQHSQPHTNGTQQGMSRAELRQRAAIAAMQSLLTVEGNPDTVDELVVHAVRCADALVAELEKKP